MTKLFIKFRVNLWNFESEHSGAIFHRWLPNGEKDAVKLISNDSKVNIRVWFERCGYTEDNFIRYNEKRREVDPKIMTLQGCLYSGPLYGMLEMSKLPPEQIQAIRDSKKGDEIYINLTKKLVNELIYLPVNEFIERVRNNFGQYWIRQLPKYDSRQYSLGYYASHILNMHWSLDDRKSWKVIDPDTPETVKATFYALPAPDYLQFLMEEDWKSISNLDCSNNSSNQFLIRSHRLCKEGNLRLAFIEAVTALDLSIHEFIRKRAFSELLIKSSKAVFSKKPLRTQLTILCSSFNTIPQDQIERSIKAIKLRNKIVHNGVNPSDKNEPWLYALLNTVSYLSGNEVRKFPSKRFSKCSIPESNWP